MFRKALLAGAMLLAGFQSGVAGDRDQAKHALATPAASITPSVPGVVYVKFKSNSKILGGFAHQGNQIQSIGKSGWEKATTLLGMTSLVPFDAHAPKDEITHSLGIDRMYCIYYKNLSIDPHEALRMLIASGEVENGSARYAFPISKNVNDPDANQQYALDAMRIYKAWDHTTGDTNVVIADVDCATNVDHEDLKSSLKLNWGEVGLDKNNNDKRTNGIDDDNDGVIDDWNGVDVVGAIDRGTNQLVPDGDPRPDNDQMSHGTETAGCIAATGNNGLGIAGVAYGCKLLAVKASDNGSNIIGGYEGIQWAITHGARVINCSWGGTILASEIVFANTLLEQAMARNILIVAAAGNFTTNNDLAIPYPSNGPGVLSVGATTASDAAAGFSNYGNTVSVWAPGEGVLTTGYPGNSSYTAADGTSFSSPLTAGVVGLMASVHPDWPMRFITRQIVQTCDNVVNPSNRTLYWGRVNAQSAFENPMGPGLLVTSYSVNGVTNDSLGVSGSQQTVVFNLKNVIADGTNLIARVVPLTGITTPQLPTPVGSILVGGTSAVSFAITRSELYSEGPVPFRIAVTDNNQYVDTLVVNIPLKKTNGFSMEQTSTFGSSITRTSHTAGWVAYGFENGSVVSEFAREASGVWEPVANVDQGRQGVYCVEARDSNTAFFGTSSTGGSTAIYWTDDAGTDWQIDDVHTITPFVNTIHFFDQNKGIFIGDPAAGRWGIGTTTDGGQSWKASPARPVTSGTEQSWNNATAWVGDHGWFGTNAGHIYRTSDRGVSWKSSTTPYLHSLSVAFNDDTLHGIACFRPTGTPSTGTSGLAITSNGGTTWATLAMPDNTMMPGSVRFVPHSDIAFVSSDKGLYRTSDFGTTWKIVGIPTVTAGDVTDMAVYRGQGKFTISLLSGSAGVASYQEALADPITPPEAVSDAEKPLTAQLLQNSPNPMHGVSTITFELPKREFIRLAVYDAIGREVALLVNGIVEPGTQSAVFNAENLTPGVYYYTLAAEDGAHITRAMTVLR